MVAGREEGVIVVDLIIIMQLNETNLISDGKQTTEVTGTQLANQTNEWGSGNRYVSFR